MRARIAVLAVVIARGVMACVDGVTPDCSNPAACAPFEGDAAAVVDASSSDSSRAETSTGTDAAGTDARSDAGAKDAADADGG